MSRRTWIEGLSFIAIGLISSADSLRLIFHKDPQVIYDVLGPGGYLLLQSIGLILLGAFYIYHHSTKERSKPKEKTNRAMRIRLLGSIGVFGIYLILIHSLGYVIASFVFFILEFRVVGIKSWPSNILLSIVLTGAYYFIFVKYCNMAFPRGLLF